MSFADARHFVEHFLHPVERILLRQLRGEIREHAAGNLGGQNFRIDTGKIAFKLAILSADRPEVFGDGLKRFECRVPVS